MDQTANHEYKIPEKGARDWHSLLNENFEAFETDIELRDEGTPGENDYEPVEGAKYLDTNAGIVYEGTGSEWNSVFRLAKQQGFNARFEVPLEASEITLVGDGPLDFDGSKLVNADTGSGLENDESDNLAVAWDDADDLDADGNVTSGGGGGIGSLTGGDGINPTDIGDGSTLSVVWGDADDLSQNGTISDFSGASDLDTAGAVADWSGAADLDSDGNVTSGGVDPGRYLASNGQLDFTGAAEWGNEASDSDNQADEEGATIGGGQGNTIENDSEDSDNGPPKNATIPGGEGNTVNGSHAFAAGRNATAVHDGSFVWGDHTETPVESFSEKEARFQGRLRSAGVRTNGPVHYVNDADDSGGVPNVLTVGNWRTTFKSKENQADEFRIQRVDDTNVGPILNDKFWVDEDGNTQAKGTKNFVQTVETDDGPKDVYYTSTEADRALTETTGVAQLEDGRAEIDLPEHFGWVTSEEEPLHVQVTPYGGTAGLKVVERSTVRIVVEDLDGEGNYEFSYTVKGTRAGYEDKQVVRDSRIEG